MIWRTRWGRQLDLHSTQTPDISTQNTRKHNRFHTCKHISPEPYRSPHLRTVHPDRQLHSPDMDTLLSLLSRHSAVLSFFFPCPGRRKHHAFWYKTKDVQSLLVLLCHHAMVTLNYTSLSSLNLHTRLLFLTYIPAKSIDRSVAHMSAHLQAVFFQCCLLPPGIVAAGLVLTAPLQQHNLRSRRHLLHLQGWNPLLTAFLPNPLKNKILSPYPH